MNPISQENKTLARYILEAFGGEPRINAYYDDSKKYSVDILCCKGRPEANLTSYSTIGLSDFPTYQNQKEFEARVEVLGLADDKQEWFANVLATIAFYIIKDKLFFAPGFVLKDCLRMYNSPLEIQHIYFTAPFCGTTRFKHCSLKQRKLHGY